MEKWENRYAKRHDLRMVTAPKPLPRPGEILIR
jgi:hypothetical protein